MGAHGDAPSDGGIEGPIPTSVVGEHGRPVLVQPTDLAVASGHYDLVRELLYLDANLLIKLSEELLMWQPLLARELLARELLAEPTTMSAR